MIALPPHVPAPNGLDERLWRAIACDTLAQVTVAAIGRTRAERSSDFVPKCHKVGVRSWMVKAT